MQTSSLSKFQKILFNLKEMLEYRATFSSFYAVLNNNELNKKENIDNFNESFVKIDLKHIRIILSFDDTLKLRSIKTDIKKQLKENTHGINHFIIVINDEKAKHSKSQESELKIFIEKELQKNVEIFFSGELLFNVLKHVLVPKHEIVSEQQKNSLMDEYQVSSLYKLPWIRTDDPVCRFIGAKNNDVVKITRYNKDSGIHVFYRFCVS